MNKPAGSKLPWGAHPTPDGTAFNVWAPAATKVDVITSTGDLTELQPGHDGWHHGTMAAAPPGSRYRFLMDGITVPDPASAFQPGGAEGWSEVVDHHTYKWSDAGWHGRPWHETVLYELHIGTFSSAGTFLGAIPHLDHLAALGVTMVELMPIGTFPGSRNWGYDGVLPFAPHPAYGPPDDLRRLVDACHARGISVVLDVVYNHFGPAANAIPGYAPAFFTDRHETPWGAAIDFDGPESAAVRAFFIQNAIGWIVDFHMDGLRLDAVQVIFDDGPEPILEEIARRVREAASGRIVHLTLENDNNAAHWLAPGPGGYAAQWNDDFHHVMRVLVTGRCDGYYVDYADQPLHRLGKALAEGFSYQGEASTHRPGLRRGTPSAQLPPTAFVNFLQNHDQVGNTPFGRRLTALAPAPAVRLGTAVLLLAPAIPMLFMGQEWGSARPFDYFCDYGPEIADMVRNGRRAEFSSLPEFADPDTLQLLAEPNAASTRDGSVLDWDAVAETKHADWLNFHRTLLDVRHARLMPLLPAIGGHAGSCRVFGGSAVEVTWRLSDGRSLVMAANFSDDPVAWRPPQGNLLFHLAGEGSPLAAWDLALLLHPPG